MLEASGKYVQYRGGLYHTIRHCLDSNLLAKNTVNRIVTGFLQEE